MERLGSCWRGVTVEAKLECSHPFERESGGRLAPLKLDHHDCSGISGLGQATIRSHGLAAVKPDLPNRAILEAGEDIVRPLPVTGARDLQEAVRVRHDSCIG